MCGIAGIFAYRNEAAVVERVGLLRIRDHMQARGPDGAGAWLSDDQCIGLAHRRLAIIDLSEAGAQPMLDMETGNRIVFNGEIYNYQTLRAELESDGLRFQSHTDTEVLLKLYAAYGQEMLHKLRGMFAFAIWDEAKQGLFLARDPFGIKPLYLADDGKTLRFASQVKALLAGGMIDTAIEPAGHVGFYLWGHVPEPYTLYRGIRALPAGTSFWLDKAQHRVQKTYFNLTNEIVSAETASTVISPQEARAQLRDALIDSVRHHLVADVPVGLFLSAGLDSSTLVALAKEIGAESLRTITLGFKEFAGTQNDEVPLATTIARHYGTTHTTQWVSRQDFVSSQEHLLSAMDQPSIDGVNSYFVSKAAKESGLKVALSGLGGDELFAGYSDFQDIPRLVNLFKPVSGIPVLGRGFRRVAAPLLKHLTSPKYAGLLEYGGDYAGAYLLRRGLLMPWELPTVLDGDLVREGWRELQALPFLRQTITGVNSSRLRVSALETACYMRNQTLRDTDWASMAHSLEVRVPLVDIELFRTVTRFVCSGEAPEKRDIAAALTNKLPAAVLERQKTGFSVPVREWLIQADSDACRPQMRGLRSWQAWVYRCTHQNNIAKEKLTPLSVGLLASEVTTRGGIQSFMLRVAEVLSSTCISRQNMSGYCISLNDTTRKLIDHSSMSKQLQLWGAGHSKARLISYTITNLPKTDVLFVGHLCLAPLAYLLKLIGRVRRYYVILHGIEAWKKVSFINRLAFRRADKIIATTSYTAQECGSCNDLPIDRFVVIPLCADEQNVIPSENFKLNGEFKLLCVARQDASERYKGFEHIFQALAKLQRDQPNIHLNMVGTGDDQQRLRTVANDMGVGHQITFWGGLSDEDLAAAYSDCDLFVMPSKKEGFGIVFLEAMRYGKPCIGGNHGGTPDVIEHGKNGYLVEYGEIETLASFINKLAFDPILRNQMGNYGRDTLTNMFSKQLFTRRYADFLTSH